MGAVIIFVMGFATMACALCDAMDGPVATDAIRALDNKNVNIALKWVAPAYENEARLAFGRAMSVRQEDAQVKELADLYFIENLVRLHRQSEGKPYTGVKPVGAWSSQIAKAATKALQEGTPEELISALRKKVSISLRDSFSDAYSKSVHQDEGLEEGREYVAAYLHYIGYVEHLNEGVTFTRHCE